MRSYAASLGLVILVSFLSACGGGSGGSSASNNESPAPPPPSSPDFTLTITSNSTLSIQQAGTSIPLTVTVNPLNGFTGSVSVSFPTVPAGVSVSPAGPLSIASMQSQTVMVSASTAASVSPAETINVQGASGALSHTAPFTFAVTAVAPFQITLNPSTVTLTPNATATVEVGLVAGPSLGNSIVMLDMNSTSIPNTGVSTQLDPPILSATQPTATLTLQASLQEQPVSNVPVSIAGVVGADVNVATLSLNVTDPFPTSTAPSRTTFRSTDMDPTGVVYDPIHKLVFVAVVQLNEVVVYSSVDAHTVATISVPEPDGVDITADGTQVIVGSRTRFFAVIDIATLQVVNRVPVPTSGYAFAFATPGPERPVTLASGKVLFLTRDDDSTATEVLEWDPVTGNFTNPTPSGMVLSIESIARSLDHSHVVATTGSMGNSVAVFDSATDAFGPVQNIATSVPALNPDGSRIAVLLGVAGQPTSQIALLDSQFNTLAVFPTNGQVGNLVLFSADGSALYAVGPQLGVALNANSLSPMGSFPNPVQGLPASGDVDETGMIFVAESLLGGTGFIDASTPQALGLDFPYDMIVSPPQGSPTAPSPTTLGAGGGLTTATQVYFGAPPASPRATPGANVSLTSATTLQVTPPKSAQTGPVNVSVSNPDGWLTIVPNGYTYGASVATVAPNAGPLSGGTSATVFGYGFDLDMSQIQVSVGGQPATVTHAFGYAPGMVTFTTPAGNSGLADITVTTSNGSVTAPRAFQYLQNVQTFVGGGALSQVIYDQKRQRL
jgi:hypothetical protein